MFKSLRRLLAAGAGGGGITAGLKIGSDEKFGQAAMEYLFEQNTSNDPKKRMKDIQQEQRLAKAYERYAAVGDYAFSGRLERLVYRMNEAMDAVPGELVPECCMVNSAQPPLNYRRPALSPPVRGYEPAFGMDVPQLRVSQQENPPTVRLTDSIEAENTESWPFVDSEVVNSLNSQLATNLEDVHGEVRSMAPLTGAEGEAWEACIGLNKVATARQQLILDLDSDEALREQYESDAKFAEEERTRRGILPVLVEDDEKFQRQVPVPLNEEVSYAQEPKYQPIRK